MARHKILKNFAYGIAQKFSRSAAHFCYMACKNAEYVVTIDLLNAKIEPEIFNIERNRILVEYCRDNLLMLTNDQHLNIKEALLIARFSESSVTNNALSRIELRITDDLGKEWIGFHEEQQLTSI